MDKYVYIKSLHNSNLCYVDIVLATFDDAMTTQAKNVLISIHTKKKKEKQLIYFIFEFGFKSKSFFLPSLSHSIIILCMYTKV